MDDNSNCETGIISFPNRKTLGGQTAQGLYEVTLREEFARLNELTGSLTLASGVQTRAWDKSMVDSLEGTVVWEYDSMACPQMIVQLYRGMMKVYVNQSGCTRGQQQWWNIKTKIRRQGWRWPTRSSCAAIRHSRPTSRALLYSYTRTTGWKWLKVVLLIRKGRVTSPAWSPGYPSCK
jgi:hypothetical protein